MKKLLTSESVTQGHPDKVCDQISDSILDAYLAQDKNARVACEVMASPNLVFITGEISSTANVDVEEIARKTIDEIGYNKEEYGFTADGIKILVDINEQSADIALGVDNSLEIKEESSDPYDQIGAGDQGIVFGYACNETEEYMPMPLVLSHKLAKKLADLREDNTIDYLRPDGKSQVTVEYVDGLAKRIDTVLVSTQHDDHISLDTIKKDVIEKVIKEVIPSELVDDDTKYLVNPTGRFVIGGPQSDVGLTGRKIIVDTYGGFSRHGGGAFSGKDPSKVDRSATYMARYIAKNMVAAGLADKLEVGVAYAIGVAKPVSIYVDSYGTGKLDDDKLTEIVKENFDLRPKAIIDKLDLLNPIYKKTAAYGHFGRSEESFTWEKLDKVDQLKKYL
ncbi:methionine adenosyltransferase [uncultured Helcococcus sp.]|uniref:methionine adenosyltransferase n=1 Tax=uncultured Helcococcus sp. TaxID=1072508 RepID=UPI00260B7D56|nr:methionine adenosyltransferase [uncultured Helcococcus sp.]